MTIAAPRSGISFGASSFTLARGMLMVMISLLIRARRMCAEENHLLIRTLWKRSVK